MIPNELLSEVKAYLNDRDYLRYLNTSISLFSDAKYSTRMIHLHGELSKKFIQDEVERLAVLERMKSPAKQLKIRVRQDLSSSNDLFLHVPCYHLSTSAANLCHIPNWGELVDLHSSVSLLSNSEIRQFDVFQHLEKLAIASFRVLKDLHGLINLKRLFLANCYEITDLNCLSQLEEIHVQQCAKVKEVNALGNVHRLEFYGCPSICDISLLTNNYSLRITFCHDLEVFPKLMNCRWLYLENGNRSVEEFLKISLPNIKKLSLQHFKQFSAMQFQGSPFQNLFYLNFNHCNSLKTLKGLNSRGIAVLCITGCNSLEDISALSSEPDLHQSVSITSASKITDFSALRNYWKVSIENCTEFSTAKDVANVSHLHIEKCPSFVSLLGLQKTVSLKIIRSGIQSFHGIRLLAQLKTLTVFWNETLSSDCLKDLTKIEGGNQNGQLTIEKMVFSKREYFSYGEAFLLQSEYDSLLEKQGNMELVILLRK
jgi:hypothetical protein